MKHRRLKPQQLKSDRSLEIICKEGNQRIALHTVGRSLFVTITHDAITPVTVNKVVSDDSYILAESEGYPFTNVVFNSLTVDNMKEL
jgi:hypothetical protein